MATRIRQRIVRERSLPGGGRQLDLELNVDGTETAIAGAFLLPGGDAPVPGAVLIHGYTSRKEHMSEGVGRALVRHGIASIALDLPMHGTRRTSAGAGAGLSPLELLSQWRLAGAETRHAVGYLRARPEVDAARVALIGYSLGSFLAVLHAASDPAVRAVVVAAGGDLPSGTPFTALARTMADPLRAVRKLRGRPLLVVHGRRDRTVLPEQAQRLFDAAGEPKQIHWWDAGHRLPEAAIERAAAWLLQELRPGTSLA